MADHDPPAVHTGGADAPAREGAAVEAELVRMTFQHSWPMSLAVGVTATACTAWMFTDTVPPAWCIAWLVLINAVIASRAALIVRFNRRAPPPAAWPRWGRYHLVTVWMNGLAWGLPALVLSEGDLTLTFFYATVLCGFVAGAIPSLSYHLASYHGFATLAAAPLTVRLLTFEQTFFHLIAALTVMFVLINVATARIAHRRILEQIRLELANQALVRDLTAARDRAEEADAAKSRFLAAASHDLRQPLQALRLFVDGLDARLDRPELRGLMDNIKLSTTALGELLDALLDVSRLDSGVLEPQRSAFPLQPLLDKLTTELSADADRKGLRLRAARCSAWVESDPIMLTRILQNGLANALRHTERGAVLIGCRRSAGSIRIEIHDTGPGMTPDQLARVFEEFYQVNNPQRDRRQGLGLGLAIVRRLCALLEHEVALDSEPGRGTVFHVRVPKVPPRPAPVEQPTPAAADLAGKCVAVIDDEPAVREALRQMLALWFCDVVTADSGRSAVRALEERRRAPDLVLADFRLGHGETGPEAIDAIRARYGADIPAIVITGDTAPERLRRGHAGGYPLLQKPVSAARLRSLASHLVQATQAPATATPSADAGDTAGGVSS